MAFTFILKGITTATNTYRYEVEQMYEQDEQGESSVVRTPLVGSRSGPRDGPVPRIAGRRGTYRLLRSRLREVQGS